MSSLVEQFRKNILDTVRGDQDATRLTSRAALLEILDRDEEFAKQSLEVIEEELMCPICAKVVVQATITNCHHLFCRSCITTWRQEKEDNPTCPYCRAPILPPDSSEQIDAIVDVVSETHDPDHKRKKNDEIGRRTIMMEIQQIRKSIKAICSSRSNQIHLDEVEDLRYQARFFSMTDGYESD